MGWPELSHQLVISRSNVVVSRGGGDYPTYWLSLPVGRIAFPFCRRSYESVRGSCVREASGGKHESGLELRVGAT